MMMMSPPSAKALSRDKEIFSLVSWLQTFDSFPEELVREETDLRENAQTIHRALETLEFARYVREDQPVLLPSSIPLISLAF